MVTPVDTLYAHAKANLERGFKTISAEFAIQMIERERAYYSEASIKPKEAQEV